MVTITKPRRQQCETNWEGREGKAAALRDERKLVAGVEKDGRPREKSGEKTDRSSWGEKEKVREGNKRKKTKLKIESVCFNKTAPMSSD